MSVKRAKISPFLKQCFVTTSVCCSVIGSCGCAMGFPGVLLPQLQQSGSSILINEDQASWIASVEMLPMFLGNCLVPVIMARAGRRAAHLSVILVTLASWLIVMLANSFEMMLVGRMLQGAGCGMMMPLRSIIVGESCSPCYRGAFLTIVSLAVNVGILIVHLIGSLCSYQITALVSMSFSVIGLIMTVFSPETPSWLATKAQYDECRKNFLWLRKQDEGPELEEMILASKQNISTKEKCKISGLTKKEFYKPVLLMSALFSMVNFTIGTLLVVYPIPILNALMNSEANTTAWMVALDVQGNIYSVVAIYVIHKVKRRKVLFTTGAFCVGVQLTLAVYLFAKTRDCLPFDSIWIPGVLISAQVLCLYAGLFPLGPVLAGEVFPTQFRSYAESVSLLACFSTVFVVLKTYPDLIAFVGIDGAFALYFMVTLMCLVVVGVLLPETKGRTLQEIEDHFMEKRLLPDKATAKEMELCNELLPTL